MFLKKTFKISKCRKYKKVRHMIVVYDTMPARKAQNRTHCMPIALIINNNNHNHNNSNKTTIYKAQ